MPPHGGGFGPPVVHLRAVAAVAVAEKQAVGRLRGPFFVSCFALFEVLLHANHDLRLWPEGHATLRAVALAGLAVSLSQGSTVHMAATPVCCGWLGRDAGDALGRTG
jgi:hypothetical protein